MNVVAESPQITIRLILGLVISSLIGLVAHWRGSLSRSGILGAIITGTLIFGFGGWAAGLTLIAFFVSSSLLSHFKESNAQKQKAAEQFDKGGQRDIWQALANGGAATVFAVLSALPASNSAIWAGAFVGALATVNADTWATELGVLSKASPRLITDLSRSVERGTSGGVTVQGTMSALIGALFIGLVFWLLTTAELILIDSSQTRSLLAIFADTRLYILIATICGLIGSLFDSFLGATVQAMYYTEKRGEETEKAFERDGTSNKPIRGWRWLNNDWVNFISSLVGAGVAALITLALI